MSQHILLLLLFSISSLISNTQTRDLYIVSRISLPPSSPPDIAAPGPSYITVESPTPPGVFNVFSFGAAGDGSADDTQAFKSAWNAACNQEESLAGVVLVPKGHSFMLQSTIFTGPCKCRDLVFQIDGTIMPPDGPASWPKNTSKRQWLVFYRINGLSMQGGGLVDGKGQKWWNLPCKPHKGKNGKTQPGPCDSPVAIRFFKSSNLVVKDLKVQNSPQFNIRLDSCHDVRVDSIDIKAPFLSPNTDGIHIENTSNVQIYNSFVSNGDDCISIGAGSFNVDIRNVTCGPSHGISIGSLGNHNSRACVSNISVSDSVIKQSDNGVRIKTWQGGSGSVSNIAFHNITMDAVRNPIIIDQYYCLTKKCRNQTGAVRVKDITYSNIKGTYDVRSPPIHFACSDSVPCTNLTLAEVELLPATKGRTVANPVCYNAFGTTQTLTVSPLHCLQEIPNAFKQKNADTC